MRCLTLALILGLTTLEAFAAVRVETLQMPVWLERDGRSRALAPGVQLRAGDLLRTGPAARLVLRLDEGSLIKLGQQARFAINQAEVKDDRWGLMRGLFNVLSGAFRFTTGALGAQRRREIDIRVGVATAGIRGTDIWGRSTEAQDLICLIEGEVDVSRAGQQTRLSEPLSVYTAPREGPANPLSTVDPVQLAAWAAETEPQAGQGVMREDGGWTVQLSAVRNADAAAALLGELDRAGFAARVETAELAGVQWHRVLVDGFVSSGDAANAGAALRDSLDLPPGWVRPSR